MYAGHVGIALALRSRAGAPRLAWLVLAAQGPDWVEGALDLGGYRWVDPSSSPHAWIPIALGVLVVAGVAASLSARRTRGAAALFVGLAYLSHWPADFLTGWKPTLPGGPMVGLRLYGRPAVDFALESAVILAGWWAWRRTLPRCPDGTLREPRPVGFLLVALLGLQCAADAVMSRA